MICKSCNLEKPCFAEKRKQCLDCYNQTRRLYYQKNKEKFKEWQKIWALQNPEKLAESRKTWIKENPEKNKLSKERYRKTHLGKIASKTARYEARKIHASPSWANNFFIEEVYLLAALRTKISGFPWQVDHIIPLQGKQVCGLHVENNLQVIPAIENQKKNNSFVI